MEIFISSNLHTESSEWASAHSFRILEQIMNISSLQPGNLRLGEKLQSSPRACPGQSYTECSAVQCG